MLSLNVTDICTAAMVCELALFFGVVLRRDKDVYGASLLVGLTVFFFIYERLVKRVVFWMGMAFSRRFCGLAKPGEHALFTPEAQHKFMDIGYRVSLHIGFSLWEASMLFLPNGAAYGWYTDTTQCWQPLPAEQRLDGLVQIFYLTSMACWVATTITHRWEREGDSDYIPLYIHHLATLALVGMSYSAKLHRIGLLILFVHDASDIPLDVLRLSNCLKLSGKKWCFWVEMVFVVCVVDWFYARLWIVPVKLMYSSFVETRKFGDAGAGLLESGEWSWWHSVKQAPWGPEHIPYVNICNGFLVVLTCLQVHWFVILLKIAYRLLSGQGASKSANVVYEDKKHTHNGPTSLKELNGGLSQKTHTPPMPTPGPPPPPLLRPSVLQVACTTLSRVGFLVALLLVGLTGAVLITEPVLALQQQWYGAEYEATARAEALKGTGIDAVPPLHTRFKLGDVATPAQKAFLRFYGFIQFQGAITHEEVAMLINERARVERELIEANVTEFYGVPLFKGSCADGRPLACLHRIPFGSVHSDRIKALIHDVRFEVIKSFIAEAEGDTGASPNHAVRIGDAEKDGVVLNSYVHLPDDKPSAWSRTDLGWHTDGLRDLAYFRLPKPMLNVGLHFDDVDPQKGDAALCLLPGTHGQGFLSMCFRFFYFLSTSPHPDELCVATNQGDLTLHDGRLWHRVKGSERPSVRRSLYVPYMTASQPFEPKHTSSSTPFYHYFGKVLRWLKGGA